MSLLYAIGDLPDLQRPLGAGSPTAEACRNEALPTVVTEQTDDDGNGVSKREHLSISVGRVHCDGPRRVPPMLAQRAAPAMACCGPIAAIALRSRI